MDIKRVAEAYGITDTVNGSWIAAIADYYGAPLVNGNWMQSIAVHLGATDVRNGSWIEAICFELGITQPVNGSWLSAWAEYTPVPPCETPDSLTVTNESYESADVSWNQVDGSITNWEVRYKLTTDPTYTTVPVTTTSLSLSGLTPGETYDVGVRSDCGGGSYSSYINGSIITTPIPSVSGLVVDSVTGDSITIDFTNEASMSGYDVEYREVGGSYTLIQDTKTITGLTPTTDYEIRVRWRLNGHLGDWSSPVTGTTGSAFKDPYFISRQNDGVNNNVVSSNGDTQISELIAGVTLRNVAQDGKGNVIFFEAGSGSGTAPMWRSDDWGDTWTSDGTVGVSDDVKVYYMPNVDRFVQVNFNDSGSTRASAYSDDGGVTWTSGDSFGTSFFVFSSVYSETDEKLYIIGDSASYFVETSNGINWTSLSTAGLGGRPDNALWVPENNHILASSFTGDIYEWDGSSWSTLSSDSNNNRSLIWIPSLGRIIKLILGGVIEYSDDLGTTWSSTNSPSKDWRGGGYNIELDRVVAAVNVNPAETWYSDDGGINWIQSTDGISINTDDAITPFSERYVDFEADNVSPNTNDVVQFTALDFGTVDATSYLWDFGDGNTSTDENPTHTYTTSGTYDVSLTVTNPFGAPQEVKASYITVSPTPDEIFTTNLQAWYDSSDLTTITKDGSDIVSQWDDKSGNGYNMIVPSGETGPLYDTTSSVNGHGYMNFNGTTDSLQMDGASSSPIDWKYLNNSSVKESEVIIVYRQTTTNSSEVMLISRLTPDVGFTIASDDRTGSEDGSYFQVRDDLNSQSDTLTANGNLPNGDVVSLRARNSYAGGSSGTLSIFPNVDGTEVSLSYDPTLLTSTPDGLPCIASRANGVGYWNIEIMEIIIVDRLATSGEISDLENYIQSKWAI